MTEPKIKVLVLERFEKLGKTAYRVVAVSNSLEHEPGDILAHEEVEAICNQESWHVTITKTGA